MNRRKITPLTAPGGKTAGRLVRLGGMLYSSSITGVDLGTGRLSAEPSEQFEAAFTNLGELLDRAGAGIDELGLVTVCIAEPRDARHIDKPWADLFPDQNNRPARKINQYPLPGGERVQIQVVGVGGQDRQAIEVPGFFRPANGRRAGGKPGVFVAHRWHRPVHRAAK